MLGISLFDECFELISRWHPKKNSKELKYRDELMEFLQEKLNQRTMFSGNRNILIKKEDGRGLCDIAVGNRQVGIELKKDLKSKSQINRLQGQIDDYKDGGYQQGIIVVLVGKSDKYVENELRYKLAKKSDNSIGIGLNQFRVKLIVKNENDADAPKKRPTSPFEFNFRKPF